MRALVCNGTFGVRQVDTINCTQFMGFQRQYSHQSMHCYLKEQKKHINSCCQKFWPSKYWCAWKLRKLVDHFSFSLSSILWSSNLSMHS